LASAVLADATRKLKEAGFDDARKQEEWIKWAYQGLEDYRYSNTHALADVLFRRAKNGQSFPER
jgi:hypothetical protein